MVLVARFLYVNKTAIRADENMRIQWTSKLAMVNVQNNRETD